MPFLWQCSPVILLKLQPLLSCLNPTQHVAKLQYTQLIIITFATSSLMVGTLTGGIPSGNFFTRENTLFFP